MKATLASCFCSCGTRATATSTTGTAPAVSTSVTTSRRKCFAFVFFAAAWRPISRRKFPASARQCACPAGRIRHAGTLGRVNRRGGQPGAGAFVPELPGTGLIRTLGGKWTYMTMQGCYAVARPGNARPASPGTPIHAPGRIGKGSGNPETADFNQSPFPPNRKRGFHSNFHCLTEGTSLSGALSGCRGACLAGVLWRGENQCFQNELEGRAPLRARGRG